MAAEGAPPETGLRSHDPDGAAVKGAPASCDKATLLLETLVWRAAAARGFACCTCCARQLSHTSLTLVLRLLAARERDRSGGATHCHAKELVTALRAFPAGPTRTQLSRAAIRAARCVTLDSELSADATLMRAVADELGMSRPTPRAALVLAAVLAAAVERVLGAPIAGARRDQGCAGPLCRLGAMSVSIDGDAPAAARGAAPADCEPAPPPITPTTQPDASPAPPAASPPLHRADSLSWDRWTDANAARELRVRCAQLEARNARLSTLLDGMLRPYGALAGWVEWWSAGSEAS